MDFFACALLLPHDKAESSSTPVGHDAYPLVDLEGTDSCCDEFGYLGFRPDEGVLHGLVPGVDRVFDE